MQAAIILFVTFLLSAAASIAFGHGAAQWIADAGYVGNDYVGCCGPSDCEPVPCEEITRIPGGYRYGGIVFLDDERGTYRNGHDELCWLCKHGNTPACLFVRPEGM